MQDTMLLIDGSSLIFQAFALPPLMNGTAVYQRVYGFNHVRKTDGAV